MIDYQQVLRDALDETEIELLEDRDAAIQMIALEGAKLAAAASEPGFPMVLRSSRNNVALRLGLDASLRARAVDARIVGIIQTMLFGLATA